MWLYIRCTYHTQTVSAANKNIGKLISKRQNTLQRVYMISQSLTHTASYSSSLLIRWRLCQQRVQYCVAHSEFLVGGYVCQQPNIASLPVHVAVHPVITVTHTCTRGKKTSAVQTVAVHDQLGQSTSGGCEPLVHNTVLYSNTVQAKHHGCYQIKADIFQRPRRCRVYQADIRTSWSRIPRCSGSSGIDGTSLIIHKYEWENPIRPAVTTVAVHSLLSSDQRELALLLYNCRYYNQSWPVCLHDQFS